jgi:uncharacterized protein (UPF0276 family)
MTHKFPYLGFGLGLRTDHYTEILDTKPRVDWFEIITENYLVPGGKPLYYLDKIRANYPVVMHGVSLSIGSTDPLDKKYLKDVKALADRIDPVWISDHLCWTGVHNYNLHDLLPLPYTQETVKHVSSRILEAQDFLGRQMLIENVSSYVSYANAEMTEWEFLREVAEAADCLILLDINNIFVSSFNHDFNPVTYLQNIPASRVGQHHLAGHTHRGDCIIDTHDEPVIQSVWNLYKEAVQLYGPVSTMIERDDNIPPLTELIAELDIARSIEKSVMEPCEAADGV